MDRSTAPTFLNGQRNTETDTAFGLSSARHVHDSAVDPDSLFCKGRAFAHIGDLPLPKTA